MNNLVSGIYKITNKVNGHCYIGSAINIEKRWNKHNNLLKNGNHHSQHLQNAWDKYGADNFTFSVLEFCEKENLINREQFYIDENHPKYNMTPIAGSVLGIKRSEETKRKLSKLHKGRICSDETRLKISLSKIGKSGWWKGKTRSIEQCIKQSIAHKDVPLSESHRINISKALKGRPSPMKGKIHSEESKKKMSESMKLSRQRRKELEIICDQ